MAAAAISLLRRGAQRHALLYLSRRHFSSNSPLTAARPLVAAARRLLSTSVESGTSSAAGSYKPPPLDPFRAALAPASPPLESPPLEEPPTAPPLPEVASAAPAAPEQDPVDLQNEELDGLKAGVRAVRSRDESPQEKEAWWLLNRAVVNYCGSAVGTLAANDPSTANQMLNYDQVFIRDFVPSAIAFLLKGESDIVKNFLLHTLQLQCMECAIICMESRRGTNLLKLHWRAKNRFLPILHGVSSWLEVTAPHLTLMCHTACVTHLLHSPVGRRQPFHHCYIAYTPDCWQRQTQNCSEAVLELHKCAVIAHPEVSCSCGASGFQRPHRLGYLDPYGIADFWTRKADGMKLEPRACSGTTSRAVSRY